MSASLLLTLCLLLGLGSFLVAPEKTNVLNLIALDSAGHQEIKVLLQQLENEGFANIRKRVDFNTSYIDEVVVACVSEDLGMLKKCSEDGKTMGAGVALREYRVTPLMDYTVSRKERRVEKVTSVIEVLKGEYARRSGSSGGSSSSLMITLVFDKNTRPTIGPMFRSIFGKFGTEADVILPGKNKGMTSVSDWHDFVVTGIRVSSQSSAGRFLDSFLEIYRHHSSASGRKAFTLLEPRPATRESMMRMAYGPRPWEQQQQETSSSSSMTSAARERGAGFQYFLFEEICGGNGKEVSAKQPVPCLNNKLTYLTVHCSHGGEDKGVCQTIDEPPVWRHVERRMPSTWAERVNKPPEILEKNPIVAMWMGISRFRPPSGGNGSDGSAASSGGEREHGPRKFCWESNKSQTGPPNDPTKKADAWIEHNVTHAWKYKHPSEEELHRGLRKRKILMLTASEASASSLDRYLHLQLSKMYYCYKHGYRFAHLLSHAYTDYFHPSHFENAPEGIGSKGDRYFRGVMSKVVMLAEAMLTHMDSEWVLWTDEDLYPNPGWMHLRLEKYLEGVPPHKLYVAANYRTTFTNIFFVRNNQEGRALVFDWIAVAMSGFVECHGYDQAAIATLHLARTLETYRQHSLTTVNVTAPTDTSTGTVGSSNPSERAPRVYAYQNSKPFGHQCLYCEGQDMCGCNSKGDWSCDFKFEASAKRAGYRTDPQAQFHGGTISSFTKGCANEAWPDFHVVTESADRPRLQCGLCTRLNEIESSGHWDGPLGGGNDKLRPGTINGWLFNHKSQFLFYEAYLDPDACETVLTDKWIPVCRRATLLNDAVTRTSNPAQGRLGASKFERMRTREHVVSLTDGYGYDVEERTFCRLTDQVQINEQRTKTYMKEYPELIRTLDEYSDSEWEDMYRHWDGGEGRSPCGDKIKEKKEDAPERRECKPWGAHNRDNQLLRRPQRSTLLEHAPEIMGGTMEVPDSSGASAGDAIVRSRVLTAEAGQELVKDFKEKLEQLNKNLFEARDMCSSPHCREVEMDWSPFLKPDPWSSNSNEHGEKVDLSYRNMDHPADALTTPEGGTPLVRGKVVQCSAT